MKDPRNEREAQPHLQKQADLRYLKHERTQVRPSFNELRAQRLRQQRTEEAAFWVVCLAALAAIAWLAS